MHDRIYKVQTNLTKDYERIREEDYYDNGFLDHIGDYVNEDTDVADDYECLEEQFPEIYKVTIDGLVKDFDDEEPEPLAHLIIDADKAKEYVKKRTVEYAEKVAKDPEFALTLEGEEMLRGEKLGTYIDLDGIYMTLYSFIIWVSKNYKGKQTFRLEGVLDYHY
jgi:hypothetical protein